jgi:hypothetical protein
MRPVFDPRLFPGLPKFLWAQGDGSSGDGSSSSGDSGDSSAAAGTGGDAGFGAASAATAQGNAAGYGMGSGMGTGGAPAGTSTTGTGSFGGGMGGEAAGPASSATGTSVGAGPGVAASGFGGGQGAGPGAATGGGGGTGAATGAGGGAATGGPGAATGGGGGTAAGGSGFSASVRAALQNLLGGDPTDALRGAVRNAQLDFGGVQGVPSMGVPEGYGLQFGPTATSIAHPGNTKMALRAGPQSLSDLAGQVAGSAAARGGISSNSPSLFGPTNTTKGSGSSTATSANTNAAPNFGGQGFGSGSPAAPSLSIGPGGIGSDAVAGGSSPNAPPGTPSLSIGPGGIGADVNAGQGVSTYGDMSDARGFGGTKGVGDPGAAGSSAVGTPATTVALGGGLGNSAESPTGTPAPGVALGGGPGNASDSPTGTPAPSPGAVTGTPLAQVVTSLINGNAGPALAQLAATIFGAPPGYGVPGTNNFGNMTYQQLQKFMGVDPSSVLAPSIGPQGPPGSPSSSTQSAQFGI